MKKGLILLSLALIVGCSETIEYKKADLGFYAGYHGYLDKQIAPDKFIVEVSNRGGYAMHNDREGTLSIMEQNWKRRSSELCPKGYTGTSSRILPINAKIEEFQCNLIFCQEYPIISGIIQCSK